MLVENIIKCSNKNLSNYSKSNIYVFNNLVFKNSNKNFSSEYSSKIKLFANHLKEDSRIFLINNNRNNNNKFFESFILEKNIYNKHSLLTKNPRFYFSVNTKNSNKEENDNNSQNIEKNFLKLDYYSMLNLKYNFTEGELRKNYVILAKHFHPDRFKGNPEIFKKLSEAYQTLRDDNKREDYNRRLKIKIHKHHKKTKTDSGYKNEENQEEVRNTSKFEEDFKKLNIEKLFHEFSNKKIKTSHEKIKVKYLILHYSL